MTVAPYQPQPRDVVDGWVSQVVAVVELADIVAGTAFVPSSYADAGGSAAIAAAILTGRELGIGPMTSLQHLFVVNGRPSMSAQLMRALTLRAGHQISVTESTGKTCTVVGRRSDGTSHTVTWDLEMARAAGLAGKPTWRAYPRALLLARASAELCRAIFSDCLGGVTLSTEEAVDLPEDVPAPEPPEPPRSRTVRRARTLGPGGTAETVRGEAVPPPPAGQGGSTPPAPPAPPLPEDNGPALSPPHQDEPLPLDMPPPLPDAPPEGERPAAAENEGPSKLSSAQRATIMTQLTGLRLKDPPATRHRVLSGILGRRITSTNNLTRDDASAVIDTLARYLEEAITPLQFEELVEHGLARFGG